MADASKAQSRVHFSGIFRVANMHSNAIAGQSGLWSVPVTALSHQSSRKWGTSETPYSFTLSQFVDGVWHMAGDRGDGQ